MLARNLWQSQFFIKHAFHHAGHVYVCAFQNPANAVTRRDNASNDPYAKLEKVGAQKQVSSADLGTLRNCVNRGSGGGHGKQQL